MKNQCFKILFLAAFVCAISTSAFAQQSDRVWSIGPEVGASFFKQGMDDEFSSKYKAGLVAGGFVTYSINNAYAFTAKVLYTQKGMSGNIFNTDLEERLSYIEVPVLARVFFNRDGAVRPNLFLGPSFGFQTGAKWKIADGEYENVEDSGIREILGDADSYKDAYNTFDFGLSGGLGVNVRVGEEIYFIVDARYTYGLTNIYKNTPEDFKHNNHGLAVTAGLSFGIGK